MEDKVTKDFDSKTMAINAGKYFCWIGVMVFVLSIWGCSERQVSRPTPQMQSVPEYWVRVLLREKAKSCTISAMSKLTVFDNKSQFVQDRFDKKRQPLVVTASKGRVNVAGMSYSAHEVMLSGEMPYIINIDGDDYRGKVILSASEDGNSIDVINFVPLEPYLAGVVGAEMPSYWEPAALQSQAVAARTYCLYTKKRFGEKRGWDVKKSQANQMYGGIKAESKQAWDAVNSTKGKVLVCQQENGRQDIFPTYYSSSCGGHTEDSINVFGGESYEPLKGVKCLYCEDIAKPGAYTWPMVEISKLEVSDKLREKYFNVRLLGNLIEDINVVKQSDYDTFSRMTQVQVTGSNGKKEILRAEDLRLTVDPSGRKLKSTMCQIENMGDSFGFSQGRGFGHGVGMCQCGAESLARHGTSYQQILNYYYPKSKLADLY